MYVRTLLKVDGSPVPVRHGGGRNIATGDDDCYSDRHFSRYVLNRGESWPEPVAIICMVTFTFIGAAVGYRAGSHIAVNMLTDRLPETLKILCARWLIC
jgi:hypothetical protein